MKKIIFIITTIAFFLICSSDVGAQTVFRLNQIITNPTSSGVIMSNGVATSSAVASSSPTLQNLFVTGTTTTGALVTPIFSSGVCSGNSFVIGSDPNQFVFNCTNGNTQIGTSTINAKLAVINRVDSRPTLYVDGGETGLPIARFIRGGLTAQPELRITGEAGNPQLQTISGALLRSSIGTLASDNSYRIAVGANPIGGASDAITITGAARNVGIGTSAPLNRLDVRGILEVSNGVFNTDLEMLRFGRSDTPGIRYSSLFYKNSDVTTENKLTFKLHNANTSTSQSDVMTLVGDGDVGIGTTSPIAKLSVENTTGSETAVFSDQATDPTPVSIGNNGELRVNATGGNATNTAESNVPDFSVYPTTRSANLDSMFLMKMESGGNRKISWNNNRIQAEFTNGAGGSKVVAPAGLNFMPVLSIAAGIGIGTTTNAWDAYLTIQGTTTSDSGEQIKTFNQAGMNTFRLTDAGTMDVDNGVLYVDGSGRRVAVGHTSPNAQTVFHSLLGQTVNSGAWQGGRFDAQSAPTSPSSALVTGVLAIGQHLSSATAGNTTGAITGVLGVGRSDSANTTVQTSTGIQGQNWQLGTGTTTNAIALSATSPSITGGSITNQFGVNIAAQKIANVTNGYGIFQTGASDFNLFNGNIGLETSAPTHSLTLSSTADGITHYNTADQTTNYERVRQFWSGNIFNIQTEANGTGNGRNVRLAARNGQHYLEITQTPSTQPIYDFNQTTVHSVAPRGFVRITGTHQASSLNPTTLLVSPVVNNSATGGYKALRISPYIQTNGSGTNYLADFGTNSNGTGDDSTHTSRVVITDTGNVGIGTTVPTSTVANRTVLHLNDPNGLGADFRITGSTVSGRLFNNNSLVGFGTDSNHDFMIFTNSGANQRITVKNSGEVGIASTTPNFPLSVTGNTFVSGQVYRTASLGEIWVEGSATTQSIPTGATYTKITAFDTNGNSAGNVTNDVANDKITITRAGLYKIGMFTSFSDGSNVTWDCSVFAGGTEMRNVHFTRNLGTGGDIGNAGDMGFYRATGTTDIDLRCKHDNGASQNLLIQDATLSVEYAGE